MANNPAPTNHSEGKSLSEEHRATPEDPAPIKPDETKAPLKKPYSTPHLTIFGKVRNLTGGAASVGSDAGTQPKNPRSDREVKENILRIGTHPLGIGLYLFDYKPEHRARCGYGKQLGVMADEVEAVMPDAVSVDADGYRTVDYGLLKSVPS